MIDDPDQIPETDQTPQEFEAEEERKLVLRRSLLIGALIFAAAFYFVWANFINFGTLRVTGDAPFSVNVIGEASEECEASPCDIKLKRGEKLVSISKEGFTANSITAEVVLWDTVTVRPVFKLDPYIKEVTSVPEGTVISKQTKYKFVYDASHNNYAIIKDGDDLKFAISYFGGKLKSPFLIGSDKAILALENTQGGKAFYINAITQERTELNKPFTSALSGSVSPNGRYFLLEDATKILYIVNQKEFSQIRVPATFNNAFWTLRNTLILAYLEDNKYIFIEYNPVNNEQRTLFSTDSMLGESAPKNIKVNPASNTIFFESGDKKFEIIF